MVHLGLSLALVLGATSAPLFRQELPRSAGNRAAIRGEVRFAQGGGRADGVLVSLESLNGGMAGQVTTDRAGKFSFTGISKAVYRIMASLPGFRTMTREVNLTTTPTVNLVLSLSPDTRAEDQIAPGQDVVVDARAPKEARDEYERGRTELLNNNDTAEGILHLERAVGIYPEFLQAQLLLGTAYLDSFQMDKAEAALKRVLEINPNTPQALLALGEGHRLSRRYTEAEKELLRGLQLNSTSWQGHLCLGRIYLDTGQIAKAGPEIGRALQLNPKNAGTYLIAGNLLLKADKTEEALQMYQQYLRLAPDGKYADEAKQLIAKIKKAEADRNK